MLRPSPGSPQRARARDLLLLCCAVLLLGLSLAGATARADSQDDRRLRTGARLFLALLAADLQIDGKTGRDGALDIGIYSEDSKIASSVSALIMPPDAAEPSRVRGLPLRLRRIDQALEQPAPMAVFLATPLAPTELEQLIAWSIRHQVILYSPFEGDVERGVLAGLSIEAKVLPYLNGQTLRASNVQLKPFFLKIAKVHQ